MPRKRTAHENIWNFVCYQRTQQALVAAHELVGQRQPLSAITGAAGAGKTFSAEHYISRHDDCRLAVCPTRHLATPRAILAAVAEAIGIAERPRHLSVLYDRLRDTLSALKLFVVMDEADQLRAADMDMLRYLAEDSDCGFCFLGCPSLTTVLQQKPALARRVGYRYNIPVAKQEEVQRMLLRRFEAPVIAEIYRQTNGNLGHLERMLHFLEGPEARGEAITPEDIAGGAQAFLLGAVA